MDGKVIIFSAPSGSGKSTIINLLLKKFPQLEFSISATSRSPRGQEKNGVEYYFLSTEEFAAKVKAGEFVEWEEVYSGTCYGTLRSEIDRIWTKGNIILFDIDVLGALNMKKLFGDKALSLFVMPPSIEELGRRLRSRGTDSPETIGKRLAKAEAEIAHAGNFDAVIVNDDLAAAVQEAETLIERFIQTP